MYKKIEMGNPLAILLGLVIGLLSLIPRLSFDITIDQLVMVEDGNIFINQALMGIRSLWEPYAGYLHLYPRIIAYIASGFSLEFTPYIFLFASLLAFMLMIVVIMDSAIKTGLGVFGGLIMVALISLQPNSGEVFLNVTNAQWFLAIALSLYLLVNEQKEPPYWELILLAIVCLTGPFSLLILPVFLLKGYISKDFKKRKMIYMIVLGGAAIQLIVFLTSKRVSRITNYEAFIDISMWLNGLSKFIFFGGQDNKFIVFLSSIFWGTAGYLGYRSLSASNASIIRDRNTAVFLILTAGIMFLAGVFISRGELALWASGARYYVVPYALVFFSVALIAYPYKYTRLILLVVMSAICLLQIKTLTRQPLQFFAFIEFAKHHRDIIIPINSGPKIKYPGWYIDSSVVRPAEIPVTPNTIYEIPHSAQETNWCPNSQYIGLEINMNRDTDGWVQASWSLDKDFSEQNTLRRYYPQGLVDVHIAFPNTNGPLFFKLDGNEKINWIDVYCIGTTK